MNDQDFIFGCRSGIQKAIRRGDLNLVKTCFDTLWADKAHRNWLKWRTPILVAEEAWYLAGELGHFLSGDVKDDEKAWRRFIYRLTLSTKNKDASALPTVAAMKLPKEVDLSSQLQWELDQMRAAQEAADDDPASIIRDLFAKLDEKVKFSNYEKLGIQHLISRSFAGGMLGDKWFLLAAIILFASRKVTKKKVSAEEKLDIKRWRHKAGNGKPKTVNLPWYIFDMHTQVGTIASSIFMKHKAKDFGIATKEDFHHIWFLLESGHVPKTMMREVSTGDKERVSFLESFWWPLNIEMVLDSIDGFGGYQILEKDWKKIRKEVVGIIGWLQEKRG